MRLVGLAALAIALSACGSPAARASPWQTYDALGSQLARVTADAVTVSRDMSRVQYSLSRGQSGNVRFWSARTRRDSKSLKDQAGATGNRVQVLARSVPAGSAQAHYLALILGALQRQWAEASSVAALCQVLWSDPLMMSPQDVRTISRLQGAADLNAWRSVQDVREASGIRLSHAQDFNYVRTGPTGSS